MSNSIQIASDDRQEQIQKELQALGLRMEPSLASLDEEGHALMRISDGECVDPLDYPPAVLTLAEEWSVLEGASHSECVLTDVCREAVHGH